MVVGKIEDPVEAARLAAAAAKAESSLGRKSRFYAKVETQESIADTDPSTQQKINELATKLTDLSLTTGLGRARRELADFGKPAIPVVLNIIVGREKLETQEDKQIVNQAILALRDITHEEFGFAPAGLAGSLTGESLEANQKAIERWFGWWRNHKDSWTGPKEVPFDDLGEEEDG
jgi:hypothetical protein